MKAAAIIASIVKPLQTGAIAGLIALPAFYLVIIHGISHGAYAASYLVETCMPFLFGGALGSSLILAFLPKSLGLRKRGLWGIAATLALSFVGGLLMPIILPE